MLNFGTPGTIATLTEANGAFGLSGGTVNFDLLKTLGANDVVNVDNLSLSSLTTLVLTADNFGLATGSYHLFNFSGAVTGGTANLVPDLININTGTTRQSFGLGIHNLASGGYLSLDVSGSAANLLWTGATSTAWDHSTLNNWTGANPNKFFDNDFVTFDDTAVNRNVSINENVFPGFVTFNNNLDYAISGVGSINGFTGLTKNGTGPWSWATPTATSTPARRRSTPACSCWAARTPCRTPR